MTVKLWILDKNGNPGRRTAPNEIFLSSMKLAQVEEDDEGNPVRIVKTF